VSDTLLVLTNLPDAEVARRLARGLVEKGLAACVNVLSPCQSFYRWNGTLHEDGEIPLFIKTTAKLYPAVEAYIQTQHPYDLPEVVALKIDAGLPDYLRWVADNTAAPAATV
jgi:periplasmic divalent cation tolerance protein